MSKTFDTIEVPRSAHDRSKGESLGTKFKFWFEDGSGNRLLYKEGRPHSGEDWAEKVVADLCGLLSIPHAQYEFAVWNEGLGSIRKGVVSRSFLSPRCVFLPGIVFLYLSDEQRLEASLNTLLDVKPPLSESVGTIHSGLGSANATDFFVGYLMLDAWVGNTDRHSENWGVIDGPGNENASPFTLAPTFDHASSLGVRLSDGDRKNRLTTRDKRASVKAYAEKCKTPFTVEIDGTLYRRATSHDVFKFVSARYRHAAEYWVSRLISVQDEQIKSIFARVPSNRISETAIEFALALLRENRNKRLEVCDV